MMNGLSLNLSEFEALPSKQKLSCLYENQCTTLNLIRGYKFHQKVQYFIMSIFGAAIGILCRLRLGA